VDGVGACHYDGAGTMTSNFFAIFILNFWGRGVKLCMKPFWLVDHWFCAKLRLCQIIMSGLFLV